jgi:hypothetical protein
MEAFMKADFLPAREHAPVPPTDARIATALEYIAYHIGQIDKKLDSISMSLAHAAQRR